MALVEIVLSNCTVTRAQPPISTIRPVFLTIHSITKYFRVLPSSRIWSFEFWPFPLMLQAHQKRISYECRIMLILMRLVDMNLRSEMNYGVYDEADLMQIVESAFLDPRRRSNVHLL